jgi:hypothetical protein
MNGETINQQLIMQTQNGASEYLLLFRGTTWERGLSPEELQKAAQKFMSWFESLKQEGVCKGGMPLQREGKMVSGKGGRTVADGPFAESKEAIGGYFLIVANDLEGAVAIAQGCPGLEFGMDVEVRPVAAGCTTMERARREMTAAMA